MTGVLQTRESLSWLLAKRCAFGPMAPLNLRFACGLLRQKKISDVDQLSHGFVPMSRALAIHVPGSALGSQL